MSETKAKIEKKAKIETSEAPRVNRRKTFQGTVVSDKMNKTRVVQVKWSSKHLKYQKIFRAASKFKAHDEKNETKTGDVVNIMETRRLSKDKRWVILNVVQPAIRKTATV